MAYYTIFFPPQFMTIRRLNLSIQGFPESYSCEPYGSDESMVVGEPAQPFSAPGGHPHPPPTIHTGPGTPGGGSRPYMGLSTPPSASHRKLMSVPDSDSGGPGAMPPFHTGPTYTADVSMGGGGGGRSGGLGSPIRSSPVVEEPLAGAA
jgi:hypothetical protein